jgi:uncharacterized membrane protein
MFCSDCGKEIPAGSKFCPECGKAFGAVPNAPNTASDPAELSVNAAEQDKLMAILAYVFFVIPVVTGTYKTSEFVKYHTNQGAIQFICCVALAVVTYIIGLILLRIGLWVLYWWLFRPLPVLLWLVLCILGIFNVVNNRMKPLPVIGKVTIIK